MRAPTFRMITAIGVILVACHTLRSPTPSANPWGAPPAVTLDASRPDAPPVVALHADASVGAASDVVAPSSVRLEPFGSEEAFLALAGRIQRAAEQRARHQARLVAEAAQRAAQTHPDAGVRRPPARMAMPSAPAPAASPAEAPAATVTPDPSGATSITNNQEQGVDEGDIVKVRGDDLLILRRGRLYAVRMSAGRLVPKSVINVGPPGVRPASWYDEMLVHGDDVLVLGYGYERRATEVNRFHLDADARLTYRDTILLRSGDYYSSRNYATRVVGHHLVLYTPVPLFEYTYENSQARQRPSVPATRTLTGDWRPAADWDHVYRPVRKLGYSPLVHTVHFCDLSTPTFECRSQGVVGPHARTFYVSRRAVYLWVNSTPRDPDELAPTHDTYYRSFDPRNAGAVVYRFPFDQSAVTAVVASGGPLDQFSFRETPGALQVLVTSDGQGDGMWGPEVTRGAMGLYQIPLVMFSQNAPVLPASMLRQVPHGDQSGMLQNRFVGDYVLYGSGETWWRRARAPGGRSVRAHHIRTGETQEIALAHGVDRIEPMARDAVIVGVEGSDLHLTSLALDPDVARTAGHYVRPDAAQGETRSHGFFYLPSGDRQGTLGLPLRRGNSRGWRQLVEGSAEVMFLRVRGLEFGAFGSLAAHAPPAGFNDRCVASCMDWYGNARPIFYRGRIFALLGYELVEGAPDGDTMGERARTNYYDALRADLSAPTQ